MKINIKALKQFYGFLEQKQTELRAIKQSNGESEIKERIHVNNFKGFRNFCEKHNGKCNIYAGIHERAKGGAKTEDVKSIKCIFFDVDSIHPKGKSATKEELEKAKLVADELYDYLKEKYSEPLYILSGNGFHLYVKIPKIRVKDENRETLEKKIQKFIGKISDKFSDKNAKIDQVGDLARIMKVPGTMSVKGVNESERPHRLTKILNYTLSCTVSQDLRNDIYKIPINEKKPRIKAKDFDEKKLETLLSSDKKLRDLFNNKITGDYKSRSEAEFALIHKLIFYEVPENQIRQIMERCKIGKWTETTESYKENTIRKAMENVKYTISQEPDLNEIKDETKKFVKFLSSKGGKIKTKNIDKEFSNWKDLVADSPLLFYNPEDSSVYLTKLGKRIHKKLRDEFLDVSDDFKKKAEELLNSKNLISKVNEIIEYEMVGDEDLRLFYFLITESRRYKTQLIRPQGQTSGGKNKEINWIHHLFPKDSVYEFASSSASYFIRKVQSGEINTENSVLIHTEDRAKSGNFSFDIDQMYGKKKILIGLSQRQNGDWKPTDIVIKGPLVFYTTSTEEASEHRKARSWITNPNESLKQNEKISRWRIWKSRLNREKREDYKKQQKMVRYVLSRLKTYDEIKIPFWDFVEINHLDTDDRRREENFKVLVKMSAHVNQRNRPKQGKTLYALPQDLFIAWHICKRVLKLTRGGLNEREKKLIKLVNEEKVANRNSKGELSEEEDWFFQSEIEKLEKWDQGYSTTNATLRNLTSKGFIEKSSVGRRNIYKIKKMKLGAIDNFFTVSSNILNKEKLKEAFEKSHYKNPEKISDFCDSKYPNPFLKKFNYTKNDEFVSQEVEEGKKFINMRKSGIPFKKVDIYGNK